ncbi:MAG: universal stress protein [Pseudomonadota bacterium]|nr:universal stress protein [Pseudomonadota bacterium]
MNAKPEFVPARTAPAGPNILHPTDFGPTDANALAHAVALSLKTHARLTLLHIRGADEAGPTRNGLGPVSDLLVRWRRLGLNERFVDLQTRLGFTAACLDVPARSVKAGVLAHFEDHPVELAVLTTHAHSGLSYWFAGSVSRLALRQADTMILFLREGQRGFVDLQTGDVKLTRALIPVDGRIPCEAAIARARALLDALGPSVEKRLLHIGDAAPPGCPKDIPITLTQGPVVETILSTAQAFRADLIVMPTAGKRGLLAGFRNSVSARILDDARWPVLSVPAA